MIYVHATWRGICRNRWQRRIKKLFGKLVVIDDLLDIPHYGDEIIDPNIRTPSEIDRYSATLLESSSFHSGSDFLFIRESLKSYRQVAQQRMMDSAGVENVLVMFGGSDTNNLTKAAIDGCLKVNSVNLHVVLGLNNQNREDLVATYSPDPRVTVYPFLQEPGEVMAICDICVGALGTTTWERCYLGLPSLVYTDQASQKKFIDHLSTEGMIINVGSVCSSDSVYSSLARYMENFSLHVSLRNRLFDFIDGNGVSNIKEKIYGIE